MSTSIKKLFGTLALVLLVVFYALIATAIASANLAESAWWVQMLYFLFTGVLWVAPAMYIIRWMIRLPRDDV